MEIMVASFDNESAAESAHFSLLKKQEGFIPIKYFNIIPAIKYREHNFIFKSIFEYFPDGFLTGSLFSIIVGFLLGIPSSSLGPLLGTTSASALNPVMEILTRTRSLVDCKDKLSTLFTPDSTALFILVSNENSEMVMKNLQNFNPKDKIIKISLSAETVNSLKEVLSLPDVRPPD
jgi:uncharacterized membrane protein